MQLFFIFSLEQHGKNINWETPAPQNFSTYHTSILTDSPLHPDRECPGQPPTKKKKKKKERKRAERPTILQVEIEAALSAC